MKKKIILLITIILLIITVLTFFSYKKKNNKWDNVEFYYGLTCKRVNINNDTKNKLINIIYNYQFIPNINIEKPKIVGGYYFEIVFYKKNIKHKWIFNETLIRQIYYVNEIETEVKYYEKDNKIMNELKQIFYNN